ncbi:MAG: glycosyltransferase family 4 protein [Candidatus Hydrogenedentes bacterium]|nr:glycosyltransferase family 4 protein [Candidatus Hydrogenedentota bacterium]
MRVLFLNLYPDQAASARYRICQFLPYLRAHGVDCTVSAPLSNEDWRRFSGATRTHRPFWYHFHETSARFRQLLSTRPYDAVVLQKAITTASIRGLDSLLFALARRVVFDMDDAVHLRPPQPLSPRFDAIMDASQIQKIMARAACVLAGNHWLVGEVQAAGGHAVYFPTVVDTTRFVPPVREVQHYTLGWMGSPSTAPALRLLEEASPFPEDVHLKLVGAPPGTLHLAQATCEAWRHDTEVEAVQQMSVGLMPLEATPWNQGKCALKALTYMACARPVIATPFGAVCDFLHHGENGCFAQSPEEWRSAIESLRDPDLRRRLGQNARATVETGYALDQAAPRLLALLEDLQ